MKKALLISVTLLVGAVHGTPTLAASSCTDAYNRCLSNAVSLGWSIAETARNCSNKRAKCLDTGCWFANRKGVNVCGHSKQ
jgi:hypothetical protein